MCLKQILPSRRREPATGAVVLQVKAGLGMSSDKQKKKSSTLLRRSKGLPGTVTGLGTPREHGILWTVHLDTGRR